MALTGFTSLISACTPPALPGTGTLEYAALDQVNAPDYEQAISAGYNQQATIPFLSGTWLKLPYQVNTGSWTEDQQDNDQAPIFQVSVSATLAGDSPAIRGELNRMKQHRFLLRLSRGGTTVQIGTPEQPLEFSSRFESGNNTPDTRTHRLTFRGPALRKALGYIPVF